MAKIKDARSVDKYFTGKCAADETGKYAAELAMGAKEVTYDQVEKLGNRIERYLGKYAEYSKADGVISSTYKGKDFSVIVSYDANKEVCKVTYVADGKTEKTLASDLDLLYKIADYTFVATGLGNIPKGLAMLYASRVQKAGTSALTKLEVSSLEDVVMGDGEELTKAPAKPEAKPEAENEKPEDLTGILKYNDKTPFASYKASDGTKVNLVFQYDEKTDEFFVDFEPGTAKKYRAEVKSYVQERADELKDNAFTGYKMGCITRKNAPGKKTAAAEAPEFGADESEFEPSSKFASTDDDWEIDNEDGTNSAAAKAALVAVKQKGLEATVEYFDASGKLGVRGKDIVDNYGDIVGWTYEPGKNGRYFLTTDKRLPKKQSAELRKKAKEYVDSVQPSAEYLSGYEAEKKNAKGKKAKKQTAEQFWQEQSDKALDEIAKPAQDAPASAEQPVSKYDAAQIKEYRATLDKLAKEGELDGYNTSSRSDDDVFKFYNNLRAQYVDEIENAKIPGVAGNVVDDRMGLYDVIKTYNNLGAYKSADSTKAEPNQQYDVDDAIKLQKAQAEIGLSAFEKVQAAKRERMRLEAGLKAKPKKKKK